MKKILDIFRIVIISPEMVAILCIVLVAICWPNVLLYYSDKLFKNDDIKVTLIIWSIPFAMLFGAYKLGYEILNPSGHKKVLIKWPDYWHFKARVIFNLIICLLNIIVSFIGGYLVHNGQALIGTSLMFGGWITAAISISCVAYAKITLHDILGEIEGEK